MGTTGNYGFHYPESTDPPDGASQIEQLAEDVDGALKTVDDTASAVPKILAGSVTITPSGAEKNWLANSNTQFQEGDTTVVFSSAFNSPPIVLVSYGGNNLGVVCGAEADNVTATGFTIRGGRASTSSFPVSWVAIGN